MQGSNRFVMFGGRPSRWFLSKGPDPGDVGGRVEMPKNRSESRENEFMDTFQAMLRGRMRSLNPRVNSF